MDPAALEVGRPIGEARVVIDFRPLTDDDWPTWRELRLHALAEAPSAFGSRLADWQGAGDDEERWRQRLATVPFNLVAYVDGEPAGMVSGAATDRPDRVELISMWVSPTARGHGVGDGLVEAVVQWARAQHASRLMLNVKVSNGSAVALYRRHHFDDAAAEDRDPTADADETTLVRCLTESGGF